MKREHILLLLATLIPAMAAGALAPEPAKVPGTDLEITPTLNVGVSEDDNFYTEPSGAEDSATLLVLNPAVRIRSGDEDDNNQLDASVTGGFVSASSDDDYTDYLLRLSNKSPLLGNLALGINVGVTQAHHARGSNSATDACQVGVIVPPATACDGEVDVYRDTGGQMMFTFGQKESKGRVVLGVNGSARRFANNGPRTDALEYDLIGAMLKFGWKLSGKTSAILEGNYAKYDYQSTFDNTAMEYLLGVEWAATGSLTGSAKAGLQEKTFTNPASKDINDPAWRVGLTWAPDKINTVVLGLSRNYEESSGIGTAKVVTLSSVRASHLLSDRVEPYVSYLSESSDYSGISRTDDRSELGIGVDYKIRRYAVLGLSWTGSSMSSNAGPLLDYDRNVIALTAQLSL